MNEQQLQQAYTRHCETTGQTKTTRTGFEDFKAGFRLAQPAAGEPVAFADELISGALQGGDFSGADIQELAVKHGLLCEERREEPCRDEGCACAEHGFPTECYRKTAALAPPAAAPVAAGEPVAWECYEPASEWNGYKGREYLSREKPKGCSVRAVPLGRIAAPPAAAHGDDFQARVQPWMLECFGEMIAGDREERNHRFLEEALELVQSTGCTASEAHQLVDYVYGRPVGEPAQEVGGVMVTLAALCLANSLDMHDAAEVELARIWTKVEAIRAKQAAKPKHSPLPIAAAHGDEALLWELLDESVNGGDEQQIMARAKIRHLVAMRAQGEGEVQ